MKFSDDEMWKAIVDCDSNYDGKFLYAVKTVGVYCHPSCKSKTPLRKNVRYFLTKLDAQNAGFRPCKRCRPDLMNYEPVLEIAQQTKDLIDRYYNQRKQLSDKMKQLGLTSSHASVVFKQKYGTTPIQYLNYVRIQEAKKMLLNTNMLVINISEDIGFESLSAFYHFFKKGTGMSPKKYREQV